MWHAECNVRHTGRQNYKLQLLIPYKLHRAPLCTVTYFEARSNWNSFSQVDLSIPLSDVSPSPAWIARGSEVLNCLFISLCMHKVCISCSSCWRIYIHCLHWFGGIFSIDTACRLRVSGHQYLHHWQTPTEVLSGMQITQVLWSWNEQREPEEGKER